MPLTPSEEAFLLAMARRIVPETAAFTMADRLAFLECVRAALRSRPDALTRRLRLFLWVLRAAPYLRWGRPLETLEPAAQDGVLRWLQDNPVASLRKGFWGLRTLVFLGYYGQPQVWDRIGYRPSRNGNAVLRSGRT